MLKRNFLRHLLVAALLAAAGAAIAAPAPKVLVLGDSLSAEYGLPRDTGWVKLLADRTRQQGYPHEVVNASISGETTSGGRTRLPALLKEHRPAVVVIELGANDGLRGLPLATMRANLAAMIDASRAAGAKVLLVGIRVPPNYGREYSDRFFATFAELAREKKVALTPFLLDGFAEKAEFFQPDRIHPAQSAQPQMLDNVWTHLRPLLGAPRDGR
ncbi:MAG: arylesterase [Betaproteobacteria bacterium]